MRIIKQQKKIFSKKRHFAEFSRDVKEFILDAMKKTETDGGSNLKDDLENVFTEVHENYLMVKYLGSDSNLLHFIIGYDETYLEDDEDPKDTEIWIESKLPIRAILGILGFSEYDDEELATELEEFFEDIVNGTFSRRKAIRK